MKKIPTYTLLAVLLFCSAQQLIAQDNSFVETKMTKNCDTLTLRVGERKTALNEQVKLGYIRYSHENSSSSPNEPFAANTGVYFFEAIAQQYLEELTIYKGVNQGAVSINWRHYKVTLLSVSDNQTEVVVSVLDTSIK